MTIVKRIALVAHDNRKQDLIEWVEWNWEALLPHKLVCTGTTGALVEQALHSRREKAKGAITVRKLKSGPLGGDQQLGGLIADGEIDMVIFLGSQEPAPTDCHKFIGDIAKFASWRNESASRSRSTSRPRSGPSWIARPRSWVCHGRRRSARGVEALRSRSLSGLLRDVAAEGYVTPARIPPGDPPPSHPVAPFDELLGELDADRADR